MELVVICHFHLDVLKGGKVKLTFIQEKCDLIQVILVEPHLLLEEILENI